MATMTLNGKNNNMEIVLMEKDKEIIDLNNTNKELNEQIENLNKVIQSKDYEILSLQTEISSMESDQNIYENKIKQLNSQIDSLNQLLNERDNEINNLRDSNDNQFNEINDAFNNHMKDYQSVLEQSQNLEKEIGKLSSDLIEKDTLLSSYQKIIFDLKRENKKILILNKSLQEKDDIIINISSQLDNEKKRNEQFLIDNSELRNKLNLYCKSKEGYLNENNSIKMKKSFGNFEEIVATMQKNYKNQIEQKDRSFTELKKNYNLQMKDNEKVIEFIIEQLKYMEKCIDNNNIEYNSNESSSPYLSQKTNSLQFGLIKKNFDLIIKKVIDSRKADINTIEKVKEVYEKEKENSKQLQNKLEEEKKIRNIERSDIIGMDKAITNKQNEIDSLNKKLSELSSMYDKLSKEHSTLQAQINTNNKQEDDFLDKFITSLSSFLSTHISKSENFPITSFPQFSILDPAEKKKEKIFTSLDILTSHISVLDQELARSALLAQDCKNMTENLTRQTAELQNKLLEKKNKEKENLSDVEKENGVLSQKLEELSNLLQESNKCLEECNEEKELLKEKNQKLEHNLNMLTQSHLEMEKNINSNEAVLEEKVDMIERQNNQLLQELEIKDMQIKSLENLIRQMNGSTSQPMPEYTGKLVSKSQYNQLKQKKDFVPNDKNERELNNFLSKFSPEFVVNNPNYYSNNNSFSDTLNLSNNNEITNNYSFRTAPIGKIFKSNFAKNLEFNN